MVSLYKDKISKIEATIQNWKRIFQMSAISQLVIEISNDDIH